MMNTDMVRFVANLSGSIEDLYSIGYMMPSNEIANNYFASEIYKINGGKFYNFTTYRTLNTKDSQSDFVFTCG